MLKTCGLLNALMCLCGSLCSGSTLAQTDALAPLIGPSGGFLDTGAGFQFDLSAKKSLKTRQSLSGIACNRNAEQQRVCLLVFDEGAQARMATLGQGTLRPDLQPVEFVGISGELDAEAAATDGQQVFVSGSHAAKRTDCASNPTSRWVIRLPLDARTGRVLPGHTVKTGRLWSIMQSNATLRPYVGERKCLGTEPASKDRKLAGQQGINIEALALRKGQLMFGFRGPVLDATALVLTLDAAALFDGSDAKAAVTRLALGAHRGIRDMVAVSDGLLLLAGPDDDESSASVGWSIFWWDGRTRALPVQPRLLARLDLSAVRLRTCDKQIKPEALSLLSETAQRYELLVLSDGMCDGGPLRFEVLR